MTILPKDWLVLDSVASTQDEAAKRLRGETRGPLPKLIFAHEQLSGRGRFGREWSSPRGESLSMSLILTEEANHPRPWVLGMAAACAAASVLHCRVQWPNDLYLNGKKLGGILTEIVKDAEGRDVPVLGIGVNLNQRAFPPELEGATSLAMHAPDSYDAVEVALKIVSALGEMPPAEDWPALAAIWMLFDQTAGKRYRLPTGETGTALGIGPHGELICAVEGETKAVMAAEAILGG
jgi:BirA family biotin operon repressor/biotin-[acetyl-CoA-carboxylase] ligase